MGQGDERGDLADAATQARDISQDRTAIGTLGGSQSSAGDSMALERGAVVGRYVVLSHLGAGGMGVVYAAYDPELDRKVALKLLATSPGDATVASGARMRMLREAKALAQLAHPNVVGVHDVGTRGEQVWLAMEFVEGRTVAAWLAERRRGWREVVDVFRAIALGLSAAHRVGLMHRDVKPDNAMIGADGRVRVMDFGLARAEDSADAARETTRGDDRAGWSLSLTRTGSLLGTPAYMAPEQWNGVATDARTDQFAFCVALWEALHGERPFPGASAVELAAAVTTGKRRPPPAGAPTPSWLRRVLDRGLASEPERRWPSMDALLDALARGAGRRRRLIAAVAACGLVGATIGAVAVRQWDHARRTASCVAEGAQVHDLWDDEARAALADSLLRAGTSYGATTLASATAALDRYAADWAASREDGCRRYLVDASWDRDTALKSHECLDAARSSLQALLTALSTAHAHAVERAVTVIGELPAPSACVETTWLAHRGLLPQAPTARAEAEELARALVQAAARGSAGGRPDEALARAQALLVRADELAWPPLMARARAVAGTLADQAGQPRLAEELLASALAQAMRAGEDAVAAEAATRLTNVIGFRLVRLPEATRWAALASALLARLGQTGTLREADLESHLASSCIESGEFEQAQRHSERALAIGEAILGADHPYVAGVLLQLGAVAIRRNETAAAEALLQRALAGFERGYGPGHPLVGSALSNLSHVYRQRGDLAAAARALERALEIQAAALGPEHLSVAYTMQNLAFCQIDLGDREAARRLFARVEAIYLRELGGDHPDLGSVALGQGAISLWSGDVDEALRSYRRVLDIRLAAFGQGHPEVATAQQYTADALLELGRTDEAEPLLAASEATLVAAAGPTPPMFAQTLLYRGKLAARRGDPAAARELAARALALDEAKFGPDSLDITSSLTALADHELTLGHDAAAQVHHARALAIFERTVGADDIHAAPSHLGLGELARRRGDLTDAQTRLERAVDIFAAVGPRALGLADARFALARTLWAAGREPARARTLAEQALAAHRALGEGRAREAAAVEAWLRRPR